MKKIWKLFSSDYVYKSDEELMELVIANDQEAFKVLYDRYKSAVYHYLILKVKPEIADELIQEIFIKMLNGKEQFRFASKFKTWLWKIVTNSTIDYYRSKEHQQKNNFDELTHQDGEEKIASEELSQEAYLMEKADAALFEQCFNCLSDEQKMAIVLSTKAELSNNEIAAELNVSVGAVKSILFRAKEKLINCVKKGGCDGKK